MPADTFTATLGALLMGTGNDNNTWGSNANTSVFQILEDAIANVLTEAVTGGTLDLSGSPPPAAASQVRHAAIVFSGVLGSAQTIKVPNLTKFWWIQNTTSGAFALTIKTPSGSASTAIPQNSGWQFVHCDGANNIIVEPFNSKQLLMPDGTLSIPPYSNVTETNSGFGRRTTQDWRVTINGVDSLQITGAGAAAPYSFNVLSYGGFGPVMPAGAIIAFDGIVAPAGWVFPVGQAVSRPIANGGSVDTYKGVWNAITTTVVGNTNNNTAVTGLASDMRALGLNSAFVEGTGIPTGTKITFTGPTTATLSAAASGSNAGITLRILPYGQGDASTTFNLRDARGITFFGRDDLNGTARGYIQTGVTNANFDGTLLAINRAAADLAGGSQSELLTAPQLPAHTHSGTTITESVSHTHQYFQSGNQNSPVSGGAGFCNASGSTQGTGTESANHTHAFTTDNGSGGGLAHPIMPPSGITNWIMKL